MKKIFLIIILLANTTLADEKIYSEGKVTVHKICIAGYYWLLFKEDGELVHAAQMYEIVKGGIATIPMPIKCKN